MNKQVMGFLANNQFQSTGHPAFNPRYQDYLMQMLSMDIAAKVEQLVKKGK